MMLWGFFAHGLEVRRIELTCLRQAWDLGL